jgi:hypothetical protein
MNRNVAPSGSSLLRIVGPASDITVSLAPYRSSKIPGTPSTAVGVNGYGEAVPPSPSADLVETQAGPMAPERCRRELQAIAGGEASVRLTGALVSRSGAVAREHFPCPPAGDAHQVVLVSARRQPLVGERVPEPIAKAHGKTPAQVMLRWHLQQGRAVIPKSTRAQRIAENIDIFEFELTDQQLAAIDGLDTGRRGGPEPSEITLDSFGQPIPED